jgi:hypothetical protein
MPERDDWKSIHASWNDYAAQKFMRASYGGSPPKIGTKNLSDNVDFVRFSVSLNP